MLDHLKRLLANREILVVVTDKKSFEVINVNGEGVYGLTESEIKKIIHMLESKVASELVD